MLALTQYGTHVEEAVEGQRVAAAGSRLGPGSHDAAVCADKGARGDADGATHAPPDGRRRAVRVLVEEDLQREENAVRCDPACGRRGVSGAAQADHNPHPLCPGNCSSVAA